MTDTRNPPDQALTNVHQALQEASLEGKAKETAKNFSLRLKPSLREKAEEICERHGTELGTFFRKCAEGLVKDYGQSPDA